MTDEWYSPPDVVDAARKVMGSIDLDPASTAEANRTVNAGRYYTIADNGLAQHWHGTVWLNPPYSRTGPWVRRLIHEYVQGNVSEAVLLVNNYTEHTWFQHAAENAAVICFPGKRLQFTRNGIVGNAMDGQAIFYLGTNTELFTEIFSHYGIILTLWKTTNSS